MKLKFATICSIIGVICITITVFQIIIIGDATSTPFLFIGLLLIVMGITGSEKTKKENKS